MDMDTDLNAINEQLLAKRVKRLMIPVELISLR